MSQDNAFWVRRVYHSATKAKEQTTPTPHSPQNMGAARHLTQTAIRKSNGKKWLFTASHGARMLRESNPRTVPGRHLSEVVHSATLPSIQNARAAAATQETVPAD